MRHTIDLLFLFFFEVKMQLAQSMEFRSDFIFGMITRVIFSFFAPIFQLLLYTKTNGYSDWSLEQLFLFQSVLLTWHGGMQTFFTGVTYYIGFVIQYGLFDRFLLTPYPTLGLLFTKGFHYQSIATFFAGVACLLIVINKYSFDIGLLDVLLFLFFMIIATIFYVSMVIFYCIINLKLIYADRLRSIFENIVFFGNFPAEVFSGVFKVVYLVVLPIATWIYFPTQALLGRLDKFAIYGAIVAIIFFISSILLWNRQTKKYTSAGG